MTLQDYINYWSTLVGTHRHIKDFYRLNANEIDDAIRTKLKYPYFQLYDYEGEIRTNKDRTKFYDVQRCSFVVYDIISSGNYDQEHQKLSDMKKWGLGLLAKLYNDIQTGFQSCPLFPFMLDEESIRYYITDFGKNHQKGVLFEFDLIDYNYEFSYDPNDFE